MKAEDKYCVKSNKTPKCVKTYRKHDLSDLSDTVLNILEKKGMDRNDLTSTFGSGASWYNKTFKEACSCRHQPLSTDCMGLKSSVSLAAFSVIKHSVTVLFKCQCRVPCQDCSRLFAMYALVTWFMMTRAERAGQSADRYQVYSLTDAVNQAEQRPRSRLPLPSRYVTRPDAAWYRLSLARDQPLAREW